MIQHSVASRLFRPLSIVLLGTLLVVLTSFMVLFSSSPAFAHDKIIGQDPADGEVLETAPESITLRFNNNVLDIGEEATVVNVTDASGKLVNGGAAEVSGTEVHQPIGSLPDGAYRVVWRVVSSDGHAIAGAFAFAVGENGDDALASLPPLASDETSNSDSDDSSSDRAVQPDQNSGLSTPLVVAMSAAGIALVVTVIALMLRKRGGPPTDDR